MNTIEASYIHKLVYIPPHIKTKLAKLRPYLIKSLKASVETFKVIDSLYSNRVSLNAIKHNNKYNNLKLRNQILTLSSKLNFFESDRSSQLLIPVTPFIAYNKSASEIAPPVSLKSLQHSINSLNNSFSKE
jgi:hypothetical protein